MDTLKTLKDIDDFYMTEEMFSCMSKGFRINMFVSKSILRKEIIKWIKHLNEMDYFKHLREPFRSYEIAKIQGQIAILEQIFNIKFINESS